jgi:hypothetical protein
LFEASNSTWLAGRRPRWFVFWLLVIEVARALVSPKLSRAPAVKRHGASSGQGRCQRPSRRVKGLFPKDLGRTPAKDTSPADGPRSQSRFTPVGTGVGRKSSRSRVFAGRTDKSRRLVAACGFPRGRIDRSRRERAMKTIDWMYHRNG